MRAWPPFGRRVGVLLVLLGAPTAAIAQVAGAGNPPPSSPPLMSVSMDDAVRLALERNQTLRAQRLNIDESKADEITASLKPNPSFSATMLNFPLFTPDQINSQYLKSNQNYAEGLSYLFERGGKRNNRMLVAGDTTDVTARTVADAERQLRFQAQQAFIMVLLSKSTLALAEDDLMNFSSFVDISRDRLNAGDIAEADFLKIALQKLQFDQDVSTAELSLAARSQL